MKKIFILIITIFVSFSIFAQQYSTADNSEVIYRAGNVMRVRNTTPTIETWKKVESTSTMNPTGGNFGIGLHGAYASVTPTTQDLDWEVGGNLYYNFGHKYGKSKFGLSVGFDYAQYKNEHIYKYQNIEDSVARHNYCDLNAGIIIYKYVGAGVSINLNGVKQIGPYINLYLPVSTHFGFMLNSKLIFSYGEPAKVNSNTVERWSVGGGIIFQIPTNL